MELTEVARPTFIKKSELKEGQLAIEKLTYSYSAKNSSSQFPDSLNHYFEDAKGNVTAIGGDTVLDDLVENQLVEGAVCSLKFKGKKNNKGESVRYNNWSLLTNRDQILELKKARTVVTQSLPVNPDELD